MAVEITGLPPKTVSNNSETAVSNASKAGDNGAQSKPETVLPTADTITITRQAENLQMLNADINAQSEN